MPTFDDFRNKFPSLKNASDEEIIEKASKVFKLPVGQVMDAFGYELNEPGLWSDVKRGTGQMVESVGSTLRDIGAPDVGKSIERYGHGVAFKNPSEINSFAEAIQRPGTTAREAIGEVGPQVGGSLATGAAGAAIGTYAGGALGSLAGPGGTVAGAYLGGALGFKGGQFVGNLAQEYGGIRTEQREAGIEDKPRALAAATAAAALDTGFGIEGVLGKVAKGGLNILSREAGKGITGHVLKQGAIGFGTEAITEGGQTALERWGAHKDLLNAEAGNEYGLAMLKGGIGGGSIRGGMSAFAGEHKPEGEDTQRKPLGDEVAQAFQHKDITQPDITAAAVAQPPAPVVPATREHITEDGEIIQVPVAQTQQPPAVSGGSTDIALAQQQAQQQAAQQQAQAQQAEAAQQAAQQFGVVNPANPSVGSAFGQKIYGPNISAVASAIANFTVNMQPQQVALAQAITKANEETGGQLIKYKFNATDVAASVQKGFQAVEKVASQLQIAHVQSVDEAAQILNDQSEQAKGDKLDQLNAIFQALTGKNTNGYEAAQLAQLAKGAKDGKLQLQTTTGLGTVPVQGNTGEAISGGNGPVRPTEVQPVGATSVGAGPLEQQVRQLPAEGIRPSTSADANLRGGQPTPNTQVIGATNVQETPASTETGARGGQADEPRETRKPDVVETVSTGNGGPRLYRTPTEYYNSDLMHISPERRGAIVRQLFGAVLATKGKISADQRVDIIEMTLMEGMTSKQIAAELSKSGTAVSEDAVEKQRERMGFREADDGTMQIAVDTAEGKAFLEKLVIASVDFRSPEFPDGIGPQELGALYAAKDLYFHDGEMHHVGEAVEEEQEGRTGAKLAEELYSEEGADTRTMGTIASIGGSQGAVDSFGGTAEDKLYAKIGKLNAMLDMAKESGDAEGIANLEKQLQAEWAKFGKQQSKRVGVGEIDVEEQAPEADLTGKPLFEEEEENAVQEPSAEKVPVRKRAGGRKTVGQGNAKGGKVAAEGEAKDEAQPKQEIAVLTPAEKWEVIAAEYPLVPPYESLTKDERIRWDDLAARTEVDVTDVARIVGVTKAAPAAQLTDESNILDGEGLVREITPEQVAVLEAPVSKLTEGQTVRLEKHYGVKRGSSEFFTKLHNDISLYAAKGAAAVNAAVRDIIKAVYTAVLAVAVVFNPTYMNKAEAYAFSPVEEYSVTQEVRAEAPAAAASKMSPAAKEAYATLMPALKAELTAKDKLLVMADKPSGCIFVFTPDGKLVIEKKSLFGLAKGDFYKGNNDLPSNRITPAGLHDIVMVDAAKGGAAAKTAGEYDFGKVFGIVDKNPGVLTIMHSVWLHERDAAQRQAALKSETAADSRYSFGCINVDKVTYKNLIDNHGAQMDGAKLFVVPDNQERLKDFVTGKVAQNLTDEDKLVRQAVTPVTQTTTGVRQNATQAAATERTVVGKEEQAPASSPAQQAKTVQQSRRRKKGETYTAEQLTDSLLDFTNRSSLGKDVFVVDDIQGLHDLPEFADLDDKAFSNFLAEQKIDPDTQAFVHKGKAYLIAGHIQVGEGRGVFMHEVGSHLGIQRALNPETFSRLYDRVVAWAKRDDGSLESDLAAQALGRMLDAKVSSSQARQQEAVAYFIEAAVNAGINPRAYEKIESAGLREWMRTLWAAFKNALRMVRGVNIESLTGQDLVDLAYGYTQMNIAARFHGTNAAFRRFNLSYMGSGVGNQQYGWGAYFAQRRMTGETYSIPEVKAPADTKSYLHAVDLAVNDDEWLHWDRPVAEQSAKVQAVLDKLGLTGKDGGDQYTALAVRLFKTQFNREPENKRETQAAYKAASQLLDKLGIKGINYRDANDINREARNLVVFNDKNIVRVQTQYGTALDRKVQSNQTANIRWEGVQQSRAAQPAGMFAKAGEWLDQAITSPKETLHKLKLGFLTLDQLAELDKSPNQVVRAYSDVMTAMQKMSKDMVYKAAQIDQLWAKLDPKESERLSNVMRSATRAQFDPAITRTATNQEQQDILDAYNGLTNSGRDVYGKVKKYYEDAFQTRLAIMEEAAAKLGGKELQDIRDAYAKLKGPYFPLGRTGNYYAVGMSPRVAELAAKKEDQGLTNAETIELNALRKKGDQYRTSSFNTLREAKQAAEKFKAEMGSSYYNEVDIEKRLNSTTTKLPNFAKMEEYITSQLGGETHAEVKSMLNQMMFDMLPEHHALKNQMRREGIYGENEDMRQVFASTSISQSHYISRLKFGHELNLAMMNIGKLARRDIDMQQIKNELALRTKVSMDNTQSALTDAMVNASYFAHLGLSPAFLLTNMTQVPMITAPWLGARHGVGATKRAMATALVDTAKMIKSTYKGGDWRSELDWNSMFPVGSNEDRMFRELLDRNVLDITMEHDLAAVANAQKGLFDDKISKATKGAIGGMGDVVKLVNTPVRITELANRATTALSAYRLKMQALASSSMTAEEQHKAAVDYAARAVSETQLNYSELNAPRHMRQVFGSKPLAKMIFQFRKYQQGMLYLIAKNISDALPGSKATAEDRRIARRTIAGLYMTTGLMAGTTGMPLMGTVGVAGIANLIAAAFGDEDEPWDFETEYRNFLTDWLGHDMALLVAKGLPAYLGVDLSKRVGMGDIANPIPFVQRGQTGQSTVANALYAAGGAPIGMVGTTYDGLVAMANGDVMKGMEKVIPVKAVKDALRTYRYADEGMTDKRGNVILAPEKFDTWDLALRGMGFTPTKESEYYEANAALQEAKVAATDVRTRLLRKYAEARMKDEDMDVINDEIDAFNERHPEKGVRIDVSAKLKSVQARRKMAAERTESGVRIGKYEKPFAAEARFATQE